MKTKKLFTGLLVIVIIVSMNTYAFAEETPTESDLTAQSDDIAGPNSNRYRNEEVLVDTLEHTWVYPPNIDKVKALRKAYVTYQYHYEVYQVMIGNPGNRHLLYHKYVTRWTGLWRFTPESDWMVDPMYNNIVQTTRERGAYVDFFASTVLPNPLD